MKHSIMPLAGLLLIGALVSGCVSDQVTKSPAPDLGFHTVDLTHYYDKTAGSWPAGRCWSAVP